MTSAVKSASLLQRADVLPAMDADISTARSLPSRLYTDPQHFAWEMEQLFRPAWVFLLPEAELPNRGDMVPLEVAGGYPIVVVRDLGGRLRAFHNVCKHRGVDLVPNPERSKPSMICRYHGWVYGLDGCLLRAPHYSGYDDHEIRNQSPDCLALTPVRIAVWNGLVFANLSGDASDLHGELQPLSERWSHYRLSDLRLGGKTRYRLKANWKLAVENYLDSYHNPFVHPALNAASSWEAHYNILEPSFFGVASRDYDSATAGHDDLPRFPDLPEPWRRVAEYPAVLPSLLLGVHPDYLIAVRIEPRAFDEVDETFYFFFVGDESLSERCEAGRKAVMTAWDRVNTEDIGVVEGLQRGRMSPAFKDGAFSPFQEPVAHLFHQRIAAALRRSP